MRKSALFICISLLVLSCTKDGNKTTESHDLESFNHIKLFDSFTTFLHESEEFRIEITTAKSRQEFVKFSINDSILEIRNDKSSGWANPHKNEIELHIYSHPLSLVEVEESGFVSTANPITSEEFGIVLKSKVNEANLELDCGTFYYWNNQPAGGKLTITGQSGVTKIWNHALMSVDAKSLTTDVALIENGSKGNIDISPTERLEYSILDVGDVILHSSPVNIIEIEDSGDGELIQL